MNAKRFVEMYDEGMITQNETVFQIVENCSGADILALPDDWRERVLTHIDGLPRDDEGWSKMLFLNIAVWTAPPPTQEEQRCWYRTRIETLREELGR